MVPVEKKTWRTFICQPFRKHNSPSSIDNVLMFSHYCTTSFNSLNSGCAQVISCSWRVRDSQCREPSTMVPAFPRKQYIMIDHHHQSCADAINISVINNLSAKSSASDAILWIFLNFSDFQSSHELLFPSKSAKVKDLCDNIIKAASRHTTLFQRL